MYIWIHHNITNVYTHYYRTRVTTVTYSFLSRTFQFYFIFWNLGLRNIMTYVFDVFITLHAELPALLTTVPCNFAGRTWLLLFTLFKLRYCQCELKVTIIIIITMFVLHIWRKTMRKIIIDNNSWYNYIM